MAYPTTPTTASADFAPTTTQETSNLIERLIDTWSAHPSRAFCGEFFMMLNKHGHKWHHDLPQASIELERQIAISDTGILYHCTGAKWEILSEGLYMSLSTPPHTYGFAQMDREMICEHIRESVRKWLRHNYPANVAEAAFAACMAEDGAVAEYRWAAVESPITPCSAPDLDGFMAEVVGFFAAQRQTLVESDHFRIRSGGLDVMAEGCNQALRLIGTMIQESSALCCNAINPPSESGCFPGSLLT
jgi:hypothetical protein